MDIRAERKLLLQELGGKLREARRRSGYTQRELAVKMGTDQSSISVAERGVRGHDPQFWAAADAVLGTAGALAGGYDQIPRAQDSRRVSGPAGTAAANAPYDGTPPANADPLAELTGDPGVRFVKPEELATVSRVSKMTIYRLLHSGALDSVRFGRDFRIPVAAARDFLKHGTQPP